MITTRTPLTPDRLVASVLAVPPLCRRADGGGQGGIDEGENRKLIRHIESGGGV